MATSISNSVTKMSLTEYTKNQSFAQATDTMGQVCKICRDCLLHPGSRPDSIYVMVPEDRRRFSVMHSDCYEKAAVTFATENNIPEMRELLQLQPLQDAEKIRQAFRFAILAGHADLIREMARIAPSTIIDTHTLEQAFLMTRSPEMLRTLLQISRTALKTTDLSFLGIFNAVQLGDIATLSIFLDDFPEIRENPMLPHHIFSCLISAAEDGKLEVIKFLVSRFSLSIQELLLLGVTATRHHHPDISAYLETAIKERLHQHR